jgi:hypothetical protein
MFPLTFCRFLSEQVLVSATFFTDGVGINVEAGIGGPAVQAGISFKL